MNFLVQEYVDLGPKTTLKTGGRARYLVQVASMSDLEQAVVFAEQKQLPVCVLGGGSNLLVQDSGYDGLVIEMNIKGRNYATLKNHEIALQVGAGEILDDVIAEVTSRGLWGLENLSHIPGTVGATPIQNVGAYGVEVADVILEVTVYDCLLKKVITLQNSDCGFYYRYSIFKENKNFIIVQVTFLLTEKPNPKITYADLQALGEGDVTLQKIRETVIAVRTSKFPDWKIIGTAGSFFKNPIITQNEAAELLAKYPDIPTYPAPQGHVKVLLGFILDKICGLKGFAVGPVRLYEKQALVLVAETGATTTDIKNFKKLISEKVFEKTSIVIEQEVTEI